MNTIKKWWLEISVVLTWVLDLGFEVVNPILLELGVSEKTANFVKILFGIYVIYRAKKEVPSPTDPNFSKLGGSNPPVNKDQK